MPQYAGTNEQGEDVYIREDGTQFTIPANVFGAGMPVPDLQGSRPNVEPVPPWAAQGPTAPPVADGPPPEFNPFVPPPPQPQMGVVAPAPGVPPEPTPQGPPPVAPEVSGVPRGGQPQLGLVDPSGAVDQYTESVGNNAGIEADATNRAADAEAKSAEIIAQGNAELGERMAQNARDEEDRQHLENGMMDAATQEANAAVDKVMGMKVDPTEAVSTPQAIGGIIGVALAGFLAPLNGGRNPALEMFERMVERGVKAQEANIANKRWGAEMKANQLERNQSIFKDRRAARAATQAQMWRAFGLETEGQAGMYNDDAIRARGQATAVGAYQKADELQMRARQWETETRNDNYKSAHQMKMDNERLKLDRYRAANERRAIDARAADGGPSSELMVRGANGEPLGYADGKESAKDANERIRTHAEYDAAVAEWIALEEEGKSFGGVMGRWPSDLQQRKNAAMGQVYSLGRQMETMGALDKGTVTFMETQYGSTGSWTTKSPLPGLKQNRQLARKRMGARVRQLGIDPMRAGYEDPEGRKDATEVRTSPAPAGLPPIDREGRPPKTQTQEIIDYTTDMDSRAPIPPMIKREEEMTPAQQQGTHGVNERSNNYRPPSGQAPTKLRKKGDVW